MSAKKSEHNLCPICKLPRGKGPHEFFHGKCAEIRAATEGKEMKFPDDPRFKRLTVEHSENGARRSTKKKYLSGKLPKWMYD